MGYDVTPTRCVKIVVNVGGAPLSPPAGDRNPPLTKVSLFGHLNGANAPIRL